MRGTDSIDCGILFFTMKILVLSDIHGSADCLDTALSSFSSFDILLLCGDYLNHGPRNPLPDGWNPKGVASILNPLAEKIIAVRGNCDSEVDQMLLHFPITAPWQQVLLEKQRLFLTHGHLFGPENLPALNQNDVLVYGHTHLPVAEQRGEIFHFNPGSVSIPKGGNPASYGMLDNDVLSVIALNDQSIIAQVAINP